jgi:predicted anti-sigma-YlaC factor YlaD
MSPACKDVSRLLSDALDGKLDSDGETLVREHLPTCAACRNCEQQFGVLRQAMTVLVEQPG